MTVLLVLLLVVHGLIHVLGFVKPWGLAEVPAMSGRTLVAVSERTTQFIGLLWLAACALFLAAAVLRVARYESWWMLGAFGVVLSQGLIVFQWSDARAGTLPNLLILVAVVVSGAIVRSDRRVESEVRALLARASAMPIVPPDGVARLPDPVRRWLDRSGALRVSQPRYVRLTQRGELRTSPTGAWMHAAAEQYFTIDPPGLVWRVKTAMAGMVPVVGRDEYAEGRGHMLIEAGGLANVVNASGPKIDQGSMLRFLGEIVWFPAAAVAPYVRWTPIDDTSAEATMSFDGRSASAVFSFDATGRFTSMKADRYYGAGDSAELRRWVVPARRWEVIRGVEVPVEGSVVWQLDTGDFDYFRWEIRDIEYDAGGPG